MHRLALLLLFALAAMSSFAQAVDFDPPYRLDGYIKAPVVIERIDPVYPPEAKEKGITGMVIAEVVVDRNGEVRKVRVLKTLPLGLGQAAADAVKQWKFRPGTRHGEPVDVYFNMTLNFKPDGSVVDAISFAGGTIGSAPRDWRC